MKAKPRNRKPRQKVFSGKKLAKLRKKLGLTQTELANKIGVIKQAISLYETEGNIPSSENWIALAGALNCKVDDLLIQHRSTKKSI